MKIHPGREPRKELFEDPVLAEGVGIGLLFQLHHQVRPPAVAADHLGEGGQPGAVLLELLQPAGRDRPVQAEHPAQVGVMDHHRCEIARPAEIALDPPDAQRHRGIEGGQRVFKKGPAVMLAAVGHHPAARQAPVVRRRRRPLFEKPVDRSQQPVFHPVEEAHLGKPPGFQLMTATDRGRQP